MFNVIGLIITTNYKTDGIYLPTNDRRHFVTWSDQREEDFTNEYWKELWNWYENENGYAHVAAHLSELDISDFNPKAPRNSGILGHCGNFNSAPEDAELADVINSMQRPERPDALTPKQIVAAATGTAAEWLTNPRAGAHCRTEWNVADTFASATRMRRTAIGWSIKSDSRSTPKAHYRCKNGSKLQGNSATPMTRAIIRQAVGDSEWYSDEFRSMLDGISGS